MKLKKWFNFLYILLFSEIITIKLNSFTVKNQIEGPKYLKNEEYINFSSDKGNTFYNYEINNLTEDYSRYKTAIILEKYKPIKTIKNLRIFNNEIFVNDNNNTDRLINFTLRNEIINNKELMNSSINNNNVTMNEDFNFDFKRLENSMIIEMTKLVKNIVSTSISLAKKKEEKLNKIDQIFEDSKNNVKETIFDLISIKNTKTNIEVDDINKNSITQNTKNQLNSSFSNNSLLKEEDKPNYFQIINLTQKENPKLDADDTSLISDILKGLKP